MKIFGLVCLIFLVGFLVACEDAADETQSEVDATVAYLNGREIKLEGITPGPGWLTIKEEIQGEVSLVDQTNIMFIDEDHSISFRNIIDDCAYEDVSVRSVQESITILRPLSFSEIRMLRIFERELDGDSIHYLTISFNEDFNITANWVTCDGTPTELEPPNDVITFLVVFTFRDPEERALYKSQIEKLIAWDY